MNLLSPAEYQNTANQLFGDCAKEVQDVLPHAKIEHVGSSSIPGAISKGDVDICVIVPAILHEATVSKIEAMGYRIKADTLRTPELCMLQSSRKDVDVALQVIAAGSKFEFFIAFRDVMRSSPILVEQYNRVKLLAKEKGEKTYRDEKQKFIEAVLLGLVK